VYQRKIDHTRKYEATNYCSMCYIYENFKRCTYYRNSTIASKQTNITLSFNNIYFIVVILYLMPNDQFYYKESFEHLIFFILCQNYVESTK